MTVIAEHAEAAEKLQEWMSGRVKSGIDFAIERIEIDRSGPVETIQLVYSMEYQGERITAAYDTAYDEFKYATKSTAFHDVFRYLLDQMYIGGGDAK